MAAHVTAASTGGPRFDITLTNKERSSISNGIWLCQNCARMVDRDVIRFSAVVLYGWKAGAESDAKIRLGKTNPSRNQSNARAEAELKRANKLRNELKKNMLKPASEIFSKSVSQNRYWKFAQGEFVVHLLGDTLYPDFSDRPGISNWLKLEAFDFYDNGIEGIISLGYALISSQARQWSLLKESLAGSDFGLSFRAIKVFKTGRIPWRNIRHVDYSGDNHYNCPHLYCIYADNGMPYEDFGYYIATSNSYEFELLAQDKVDLDVLTKSKQ